MNILRAGIDIKVRQGYLWYLYEQIRQHFKSNLSADLKPTSPKPSKQNENDGAATQLSSESAEYTQPTV